MDAGRVEPVCWFVEDKQLRVTKGGGEAETLAVRLVRRRRWVKPVAEKSDGAEECEPWSLVGLELAQSDSRFKRKR